MRPDRGRTPVSSALFRSQAVRVKPWVRAMKGPPRARPSPEEAAIRGQRSAFNDALVNRDLSVIEGVLHADYLVMPSFSNACMDKPSILKVYDSYFADPDFITFERTPERIVIGRNQRRAAEAGRWAGQWKSGGEGKGSRSGIYQAEWRPSEHGWKLMRESYVLLED